MKILLLSAMLLFPLNAYAASADMNINGHLIQCGSMTDIEQACVANAVCCTFLEPMAGSEANPLNLDETQCEWIVVQTESGEDYHPSCVRVYE